MALEIWKSNDDTNESTKKLWKRDIYNSNNDDHYGGADDFAKKEYKNNVHRGTYRMFGYWSDFQII